MAFTTTAPERRTGAIRLRPYQAEAVQALLSGLTRPREEGHWHLAAVLPTGCHRIGQRVLMADGATSAVEDVVEGDLLMGPDGSPRRVLRLCRGEAEMYEIRPNKGEPWVVNADHVLTLIETRASRAGKHPSERGGNVRDVTVREWLGWSKWRKHTHKLFRSGVDFPARNEPVLDPYMLGIILGDGSLSVPYRISIATVDPEIAEAIQVFARQHGLGVRRDGRNLIQYHLTSGSKSAGRRGGNNPVITELRRLDLLPVACDQRFVPDDYRLGSRSVRLEVLAGLIDSDGALSNGGYDYGTKSQRLAADVAFIARSLGLAAYVAKRPCGHYRVSISGDCSMVPVRVPRKVAKPRSARKDSLRTGFTIEPTGTVEPFYGFTLDGDHRYLLDDFTVTHNSGKTVVFSALADAWHQANPAARVMILAHRDELVTQAEVKYRSVVPDARIGVIKAERHEVRGVTTMVASVQSLNARRRERTPKPSLLIIDECHHATAKSYRDIIAWADCPVVGVTATLARSDGKALGRSSGGVFDEVVYERSILWMIRQGYLSDVQGKRVVVDDLDLSGMRRIGGDYSESQLSERLLGSSAPGAIARSVSEHAEGQPGVIFAPTVESAQAFTEAMRTEGHSCETVWGAMSLVDRRRVLRDFGQGKIDWLANCMVLTEGFDAPRATVAVIARATQSAPLYIQMVGRVLRPYPGKERALVLDVVGATRQHELATLSVLAGKTPRDTANKTLLDLYGKPCEVCMVPADECAWKDGEPCCASCTHRPVLGGLELVEDGPAGPIRTVEADLFAGSRQQWLTTLGGYWFIPAGQRLIAIAPRPDDGFDVVWTWQDKRGGGYVSRGVPELGYAMAQGESAITLEEETFAAKERAWRKKRASEAQVRYCKGLGAYVEGMESWRAGAVSDRIAIWKASARLDAMIGKRLS